MATKSLKKESAVGTRQSASKKTAKSQKTKKTEAKSTK